MRIRILVIVLAALVVIAVAGGGVLYLSFPDENERVAPGAPISAQEAAQTLAALKPPKRARPLVAIVGANEGAETTDYIIPYGVLKRSGVADVVSLGTKAGPVTLMPALTIVPDETIAGFDARYPDGADYVIVPALHNSSDAAVVAWVKTQAAKGATIVGVCAGSWVLANAGLLDGRAATTHWGNVESMRAKHPTMRYTRDRRYVADRGVVTTTGVSASLPISLALVEAIAGRERAAAVAQSLGLRDWSAAHTSGIFRPTRRDVRAVLLTWSGLQRRETVAIEVSAGVDEVALALTADAYANTGVVRIMAVADRLDPVMTANGLRIIANARRSPGDADLVLTIDANISPARALDVAFDGIATRYGRDFAGYAQLSLEYPGTAVD